ncbi:MULTISPECIES: type VII secretion target [unclassified Gordonia (in: high G+C Gram-positive bacteria)]|uniref:type VII secretion target n=1 Tax=unclassified Gordonia (in: high G+C Gram-positive bacteria) TaxID=2657482 RepID=UPI001F0FFF5F|nr:type VII secretion target [Gordonia sp. ABSL49_1]MCH5643579.1 type VII secretion target [Gordonia sp. ABSL49_1]
MSQLTIDSPSLRTFAAAQRSAAADTHADAARQRSAVTDLAITFGLIGAEFLSAAVQVFELYTRHLDTTARQHDAVSDKTERANTTYNARDCRCGKDIAGDTTPDAARKA